MDAKTQRQILIQVAAALSECARAIAALAGTEGTPDGPAPARSFGDGIDPGPHPSRSTRRPRTESDMGPPNTGRELYAWAKRTDESVGSGLVKHLQKWGKLQEYPDRMTDWNREETAQAVAEGTRRLERHASTV